MENTRNLGLHILRKSRSPPPTRKTVRSNSMHQNKCFNEVLKKTNSTTPKLTSTKRDELSNINVKVEISPKTEEAEGKHHSGQRKAIKASTTKKKIDCEKDMCRVIKDVKYLSPVHSKNSWSDRGSVGSNTSSCKTKTSSKTKGKGQEKTNKVEFAEDVEAVPLLSLAVYEQGQVTELLQTAKKELRRRVAEVKEGKVKKKIGDCKCGTSKEVEKGTHPRGFTFGDIYYNNLDEVLQVWMHLFYFIINLRYNLIKAVNSGGTETFKPNTETERDVVIQAIECVKFFSKLKMKSLAESLEEFHSGEKNSGKDIMDYEERISSQFLLEMEFMGKKAKEVLSKLKGVKR